MASYWVVVSDWIKVRIIRTIQNENPHLIGKLKSDAANALFLRCFTQD